MITSGRPGSEEAVGRAAAGFTALVDAGWTLPLPGGGATGERWAALADLGAADLPLARLAEGHADALAVLDELSGPVPPAGRRLGVWAADPPMARLASRRDDAGWRLDGRKSWCSGAHTLTDALVTAHADDGPRLFLADLTGGDIRVDPTVWAGSGMVASDTADVYFDGVPAVPVGGVGAYVERPGFWHGGIGVVALHAADAALRDAAGEVDVDRGNLPAARLRALRVRAVVARSVDDVLATVGRALGAGPLAHDGGHARRVADLTVYVRQHHGERDLAALGALLRAGEST